MRFNCDCFEFCLCFVLDKQMETMKEIVEIEIKQTENLGKNNFKY